MSLDKAEMDAAFDAATAGEKPPQLVNVTFVVSVAADGAATLVSRTSTFPLSGRMIDALIADLQREKAGQA